MSSDCYPLFSIIGNPHFPSQTSRQAFSYGFHIYRNGKTSWTGNLQKSNSAVSFVLPWSPLFARGYRKTALKVPPGGTVHQRCFTSTSRLSWIVAGIARWKGRTCCIIFGLVRSCHINGRKSQGYLRNVLIILSWLTLPSSFCMSLIWQLKPRKNPLYVIS